MAEKVENYDIAIIGGGAGGYTAALEATKHGFKVALIEKDRVGGTCLNRGCVPTQCLLRDVIAYSSFVSYDFIEKDRQSVKVSLEKVMERKNQVVDLLVGGTEKTLLGQGVSIFQGEGIFQDPQTIAVEPSKKVIQSKSVVIAVGSYSNPGAPFEIDHQSIWDTTDALNMKSLPESIAIMGNEHRAMTFADIFHYLGSRVSIITQEDRVLPDQDREISSRYRKILKEKNINLLTQTRVTHVDKGRDGGSVELKVEAKKGIQSLTVSKVLVPGERQANVKGLHLESIGLSLKNGSIPVDSQMMTPVRDVYAIGDAVGGKYAAHKAMAEGSGVIRHLSGETIRMNYNLIPICLYTNPEVASIGLTQEEAEQTRQEVEVGYFPFAAGARPVIFGQAEGIIKVVFEKKYGEVLGVHMIGPQVTELVTIASMAMGNELSLDEMKEIIYPHPSFSESFLEAINDALRMMRK